jgi:hypothetical protein
MGRSDWDRFGVHALIGLGVTDPRGGGFAGSVQSGRCTWSCYSKVSLVPLVADGIFCPYWPGPGT